MKKIVLLLISIVMLLGIATNVFADDLLIATNPASSLIKVQQNGELIDFTDNAGNVVNPQIINNRTMVPFRKIFNSLGVTDDNISWDGETRTVTAKKDNVEIELQIDNTKARKVIDGQTSEITLDSAPVIIEGRTLVPVRFIAESMNKKVGWDNYRRTVIIIDTEALINDLESSIPKYMELVNTKTETPDTYSNKMTLKGNVEYTSTQNSDNNSTINFTGNINAYQSPDLSALDLVAKIKGKGEIINALKESNIENINANIIISGNNIYVKSFFLGEELKDKWALIEVDSLEEVLSMAKSEDINFEKLFDIQEDALDVNTYYSLKVVTDILKVIFRDDNISIKGSGSNKTYTLTINLSDVKNYIKSLGTGANLDSVDGKIELTTSIKNNVIQSDSFVIDFKYSEGTENIKFYISAEGKMSNKTEKIKIPSDSEVVKMNQ